MAAAISGVRPRYHMQRNRSDVLRTPHRSATHARGSQGGSRRAAHSRLVSNLYLGGCLA